MRINKPYIGKWRITEMELWDRDYIDLVGQGHLTIKADGDGELRFGAIESWIDCRVEEVNGVERLEFSFEGEDEGDPVCGRGWAQVNGMIMTGRIYLHMGDDSGFTASRA
ncbi:MAG: hypothetical protein P8130_07705 [Deltaproteobacteria bacterium]